MAVYAQPERAAAGQRNRADGAHARLLNRGERRRQPQHRHRRAENQVVIVKLAGKEGCQRARRRRDVQAHLAGAGHHDAHPVLEQIGADLHTEALRHGSQGFGRLGRRESHGDGLGASQGGHHFLVDQIKKGLFGRAHAFSPVPNFYDQTPSSECCKGPNSP